MTKSDSWIDNSTLESCLRETLDGTAPRAMSVVTKYVEPSLAKVPAGQRFQFERHGYFVTDSVGHAAGKVVFNRVTGMKDSWIK